MPDEFEIFREVKDMLDAYAISRSVETSRAYETYIMYYIPFFMENFKVDVDYSGEIKVRRKEGQVVSLFQAILESVEHNKIYKYKRVSGSPPASTAPVYIQGPYYYGPITFTSTTSTSTSSGWR